jgi:hypothetical protein
MNTNTNRTRYLFLLGMIAAAASIRLIPYLLQRFGIQTLSSFGTPDLRLYPWNFSPMAAICLFGGARFADRRWAFAVPLSAVVFSNFFIGLISGEGSYVFDSAMPLVIATFALIVWLGTWLRNRDSAWQIAGIALLSEIVFFVVTNFAVWAFSDTYPHTAEGIVRCYTMALPFFRNSLIGMAAYGTILFGGFAFAQKRILGLNEPAYAPVRVE